ncbi:hypothetical protein [Chromobacterium vaccinii]|uniref:hypothetical protein n=1 Tax=Chromobacterium vaccinii TaxID=1108595 RepID=UPI001E64E83B|nr:hypothetical protein [Chromobacterium vaccinii]MCD4501455.1 hypothetical protein [Chromobacterium vaccinii]
MRDRNYLFNNVDWFSVDQHQRRELAKEIDSINGDRLLNSSVEDLCDYFEKKYKIEVPVLRPDNIVADQRETKIDVSGDRRRYFSNPGQPFYVNGTTVEISVPFEGDSEAFKVQPTSYTMNPPRAEIKNNNLVIKIEGTDLSADQVRNEVNRTISDIEGYLVTLRSNTQGWNTQIRSLAHAAIEQRRTKLLKDRNLLGDLGFKIKAREGEARTYTAPEVRRKLAPSLPPASTTPYKPEPTLANADYEHILSVIQNMVHVMERSPSAFTSMDEESIRSHFLVQLNGHYEGQATGETFNYQGKTDILIRSEGKNIFIAECKFWSGPKKLIETIDQLLGYSSWRDTKVAVIIFNRNKDFSKVLESIQEATKVHSNFKRQMASTSETMFRYVFAHRDDPNRELLVAVMAFDVPA